MQTRILICVFVLCFSVHIFAEAQNIFGDGMKIEGTGGDYYIFGLSASPDGKWIAYSTILQKIYLVPAEGGERIFLCDAWTSPFENLEFSPDSNNIYFAHVVFDEAYGATINGNNRSNGIHILERMNIETGERTEIKVGVHSSYYLTKDGEYILFLNDDWRRLVDNLPVEHQNEWGFLHVETGDISWTGLTRMDANFLEFTPDGSEVILHKNLNPSKGPVDLYRCPIIDNDIQIDERERLLPDAFIDIQLYPSISPDGKWIVFSQATPVPEYTIIRGEGTRHGSTTSVAVVGLVAYNFETGEVRSLLESTPELRIFDTEFSSDGSTVYATLSDKSSYDNKYVWAFDLATAPVAKSNNLTSIDIVAPSDFEITGNYPNPFNPATTIEFLLPETSFTELTIFNLTGQKVRELLSSTLSEGIHSVTWNGLDDNGLPVSTGMYITRLEMSDAVTTGKMLLVK